MVRYELKYAFAEDRHDDVLRAVKNHPAIFSEIFHKRQINNIYFDTSDLRNYWANINGVGNREKYRIRWYGETFGPVASPVLEIKRKFGLVGDKKSKKMPAFELTHDFSWFNYAQIIEDHFAGTDNPESAVYINNLLVQYPTIINQYQRQYFMTRDGKFRLTIDTDINYRKIASNYVGRDAHPDNHIIVEIKFTKEHAVAAEQVTNAFNWRLSRNSKYVNGVNALFHQVVY